jgi:hypothetical protein
MTLQRHLNEDRMIITPTTNLGIAINFAVNHFSFFSIIRRCCVDLDRASLPSLAHKTHHSERSDEWCHSPTGDDPTAQHFTSTASFLPLC